jgi:hypothetical protein
MKTRKKGAPLGDLAAIAVFRAEQGDWGILEARLAQGADRPNGLQLSRDECRILCEILSAARGRPRHRPIDPEAANKAAHIAAYSLLLEAEGAPTESAVAATVEKYKVVRASVFEARRKWGQNIRDAGFELLTPELQRLLREWFKAQPFNPSPKKSRT